MTAFLLPVPKARFYNTAGNAPLAGGKVYAYAAGTSTPKDTYTDSSGTTPNTNPVILDAAGEADIWLVGNYKIVVKDASDALRWTVDNVSDIATALSAIYGQIINIYAGVSGGTANALTLTPNPTLASYMTGQKIRFYVFQDNTSAVTLNVSGLGAKNVKKYNGSSLVGLVAKDLPANTIADVDYDGTQWILGSVKPFTQGADIASASTINLDTSTGVYVGITGTTAITAMTLAQGQFRILKFTGALTITNGASLICPNGANITTYAGYCAMVVGEASGVVRVVSVLGNLLDSVTASETANYTATTSDNFIPCDATSAAFTITLYAASGNAGRRLIIKKTDSTLNTITIDANSTETIDGSLTIKLATQYESVTLECDGTNWFIVSKRIISNWVSYTPTITGFGTTFGVSFWSRRSGDSLEIMGNLASGTSTAVAATATMGYAGSNAPTGLTVDGSKTATVQVVGQGFYNAVGASVLSILASSGNNYISFGTQAAGTAGLTAQVGTALLSAGQAVSFTAKIPITNWSS